MATTAEIVLYPYADFKAVIGDPFYCVAEALDATGAIAAETVAFTSSSPSVATIDAATGLFTPLVNGTTTITATAGSITATRTMTVVTATPGVPVPSAVTRAMWQARIAALSSPGAVVNVDGAYAGNLANAIAAAVASGTGWTLQLTPGTNYGTITPPDNPGLLITLTSSGTVPSRGTRATEAVSTADNFPRLWMTGSTNHGAVARDTAGVNGSVGNRLRNYRFLGLDIGYDPSATYKIAGYAAVDLLGNTPTRLSRFAENITLDRCFFRGSPGKYNIRAGLDAAGAWISAIDCDATEFHYDSAVPGSYGPDANMDSQGLRVQFGPGPVYHENCAWSSAHECIALGGSSGQSITSTDSSNAITGLTITASAGTITFSSSVAGTLRVGMEIVVADVNYRVLTFNGTTSATVSKNPTFGTSAFSVNFLPNVLLRDFRGYRSYLHRPAAWKGVYSAKNLFEAKQGLFVEMENCVYERNWVDAQAGHAIMLWAVNQSPGTAPWMALRDAWIHGGVVDIAGKLATIADQQANHPSNKAHRLTIENIACRGMDADPEAGSPGADGHTGQLVQFTLSNAFTPTAPTNVTLRHLTGFNPTKDVIEFDDTTVGFTYDGLVIEDNILGDGASGLGLIRSTLGVGSAVWNAIKGVGARWRNNIGVSANTGSQVANGGADTNNTYLTSIPSTLITTPAKATDKTATLADLAVPAGIYSGTASDGTDPGADMTALTVWYAEVVTGAPLVVPLTYAPIVR